MIPRIIQFLGYEPSSDDVESLSLGERVVRARQRLGVTQNDLALQLGIDSGTLSKWEREENKPSAEYRELLSDVLIAARPEPGRGAAAGDHETTS